MQAKDVMTQKIISVGPDDTILHAIRLMLQNKVSGLPVVDSSGRMVGIVTEGDFLRRSETGTVHRSPRWIEILMGMGPLATEYVHSNGRKIGEVMTREVRTVTEDTSLEATVDLMERYHVKRVPVLRGEKLVGIVSRLNIVRAVAKAGRLAMKTGAGAGDAQIRQQLLEHLEKQPWAPTGTINVAVNGGVVTFTGVLLDERHREALQVAAENIAGVKSVDDQLVWVDPDSGYVVDPPPRKTG